MSEETEFPLWHAFTMTAVSLTVLFNLDSDGEAKPSYQISDQKIKSNPNNFHQTQTTRSFLSKYPEFYNLTLPPDKIEMFNRRKTFYFLHIPKTGGTSFQQTISNIIRSLGGKYNSTGSYHSDLSILSPSMKRKSQRRR